MGPSFSMHDGLLPPGTSAILEKYRLQTLNVIGVMVLVFDAILGIGTYSLFHDVVMAAERVVPSALVVILAYWILWKDGRSKRAGAFMVYGFSVTLILERAISSPNIEAMFLNLPALSFLAILVLGFRRGTTVGIGVFSILIFVYLGSLNWTFFPVIFPSEPNVSYFSGPLFMLYLVIQVGRLLGDLAKEGVLTNQLLPQYLESHRQLFSVITHDISNLLFIATLSMESDHKKTLSHSIDQMQDLTREVEQIHAGVVAQTPARTRISLNSAIGAAQFVFAVHLKAKLLKIVVEDSAQDECFVWTSGPILSHVILNNLISNAIKFSPEESIIRIAIQESDRHVALEVSDQGEGIPERVLKAVEAGERAPSIPGTKGESGTGYGLKNAVDMARRLDIRLELLRGAPQGTIARLIIPKAQ